MKLNLSERLANWLIKNWKDICFIEIFILIGWSILMYALYLLDEKYMQNLTLISMILLLGVIISWFVGGAFVLFVKLKEKD